MKSISSTEKHIFFNTVTSVHRLSLMSRRHAIFPLILCRDQICSAESSEDEARCLELRRLARFPSNTEQQSLRNWESRMSSSILLCRERRFAKWMLGNGVLNPRWWSFMSAPVLCRILHPCQIMQYKCPAKHQNRRNPVKFWVVCTSECPAIRLWWNWLQGYD